MLIHIITLLISFLFIWIGAGLIVRSTEHFAKQLHISRFAVSFVLLGMLTSTPEFAIGLTAIAQKDPAIFIGNLIGGIPIIFLLIIPVLAIFGDGVQLKHELGNKTLIFCLAVILAPSFLILDHQITGLEGIFLLVLYGILTVLVQKNHGFLDNTNTQVLNKKAYSYRDFIKVIVGIGIIFVTSQFTVQEAEYFSRLLSIPVFYVSLFAVSLGTNIPELSLAVRSVVSGKKDIAFGDYLGSAAANTFLFGLFTVLYSMNNPPIETGNNFISTFLFICIGLVLFYMFSRTENTISKKEGIILLALYLFFIYIELAT